MGNYVLIWIIYYGMHSASGSAEFMTLEACEKAKQHLSSRHLYQLEQIKRSEVLECFRTN